MTYKFRRGFAEPIDEILIAMPFRVLVLGILAAVVLIRQDRIARQPPGEQALHQRPVNHHGDSPCLAPGNDRRLDAPLQHVVGQLHGLQRTDGVKVFELLDRQVRGADRPCLAGQLKLAQRGCAFRREVFCRRGRADRAIRRDRFAVGAGSHHIRAATSRADRR